MANIFRGWGAPAIAALVTFFSVLDSRAGECRLESPEHRITLVELYTSEGCNSCPPADRWLSGLPRQGVSSDIAVLLAFHVDYWNQLGWPDRFSRATFSDRQRDVAARASSGVIYTPQLVVDGRDLRQGYNVEHLRTKLGAINREKGQARIRADIHSSANEVQISGEVQVLDAGNAKEVQTWIAAFENGLSSRVTAGENAGKRLNHDYVVRELAGPFSIGPDGRIPLEHRIKLQSDWSAERMGIAIFVERRDTGEVLEASARYPLCSS
jgi:hypothetical protein